MKKFNNLKMVLFDSTKAAFKLGVEAVFTKGNAMGGIQPLVYITDQGNGALNPNIYLTLTYKGETFEQTKTLYTSYPQLFALRKTLAKVKDLVEDEKGFLRAEGTVSVRQEYQQPLVLTGIGKKNKWISFSLGVVESGENGITETFPVVIIQMSDTNNAVSTLNIEEFLTVCTIIEDLDLASIQCQMSLAYLSADDSRPAQNYNNNNYNNNYGYSKPYRPQQYQYQQVPQQTSVPYSIYNMNNGGNSYQYKSNSYTIPASSAPKQQYTPQQNTVEQPVVKPVQTQAPQQMAPRSEKPILTPENVESTPYLEVDYNDLAKLGNDIFGEDE